MILINRFTPVEFHHTTPLYTRTDFFRKSIFEAGTRSIIENSE